MHVAAVEGDVAAELDRLESSLLKCP